MLEDGAAVSEKRRINLVLRQYDSDTMISCMVMMKSTIQIFLDYSTRFPRVVEKIFICYQVDGSYAIQLFLLCSSNAVQIKLLESSTYAVLINQTEAIAASQDTKSSF